MFYIASVKHHILKSDIFKHVAILIALLCSLLPIKYSRVLTIRNDRDWTRFGLTKFLD
jgi:hypothetical protein